MTFFFVLFMYMSKINLASHKALLRNIDFLIGAGGKKLDQRSKEYKDLFKTHLKGSKNPKRMMEAFEKKGYYSEAPHPQAVLGLTDFKEDLIRWFEGGQEGPKPALKKLDEAMVSAVSTMYKYNPKTPQTITNLIKQSYPKGQPKEYFIHDNTAKLLGSLLHEARQEYQTEDEAKKKEEGMSVFFDPKRNFEMFNEIAKKAGYYISRKMETTTMRGLIDTIMSVKDAHLSAEAAEKVVDKIKSSERLLDALKDESVGEVMETYDPQWTSDEEDSDYEQEQEEKKMMEYRTNYKLNEEGELPAEGKLYEMHWPDKDLGTQFLISQNGTIYAKRKDDKPFPEGDWEEHGEAIGHWDLSDERPIFYSDDYNYLYGIRSEQVAERLFGKKRPLVTVGRAKSKEEYQEELKHAEFKFTKHLWEFQDEMYADTGLSLADLGLLFADEEVGSFE